MKYVVIDPRNPIDAKDVFEGPDFEHHDNHVFEYDNHTFSLINGKLYIYCEDTKTWLELESNLVTKTVVKAKANFGSLFIITNSGSIFHKKSDESSISDFIFEELKFSVKEHEPCPHGVKFDDLSFFDPIDIDCTTGSVYIVDSEGKIWTYLRDKPSTDKEGNIQVIQVKFRRKAWSIYCGRSHCIALCEASTEAPSESMFEDSGISILSPDTSLISGPTVSTPRRNSINPKCPDCNAESNCRLSLLMKMADETASSSVSNGNGVASETPPSSSRSATVESDTPKLPSSVRSKLRLDKLKLHFRSSKTKNAVKEAKSRTVWHTASLPLGSSLGSFGTPRRRHDSENDGVELSTIASTLPRQNTQPTIMDLTGSATFSYVNLDNFVEIGESSLSTSPDSQSHRPSISTTSNPSISNPSVESTPVKKPTIFKASTIPESFELWSWGTNTQGQLGHSDVISRREPKRIRGVSGKILKICIGDDHNVVLLASGEAYVWGSNSNGQLKHINQAFIDAPTLLRLGAGSTIIDVIAGTNAIAAIVAGQSNKVRASVYYFGKDDQAEEEVSSTMVLTGISKIGSPFGFSFISKTKGVVIGVLSDLPPDQEDPYFKLQTLTDAVRYASQLSSLASKLTQSSTTPDVTCLLTHLSDKIQAWFQLLSRLSSDFLQAFSTHGSVQLTTQKSSQFKELCKILLELHFAFIEAIGFRSFNDIKLDSNLSDQIDKLCLEKNIEASQEHSKLRLLFELPFQQFKVIRDVVTSTNDKLPPHFWKHFDRTLDRNEGFATNTYNAAKELLQVSGESSLPSLSFYLPQGSPLQSLIKPGRLVIWASHGSTAGTNTMIKVKEIGPTAAPSSTWRRFMASNFTTIVVFSDAIALIQKGDFIIIDMPLVWMNSVSGMSEADLDPALVDEKASELTVQILAPEYEFHVEFPNVEMKNQLLSAFTSSFRLHREKTELTVFDDQLGTSIHVLPQTRFGAHNYSSTHFLYRNCHYDGYWKTGVPHGIGTMTYEDGREFKGRFVNGNIHGFGEMKIREEQREPTPLSSVFFTETPRKTNKFHHYKGKWRNGKLHGLAFIQYANGDTYEGYCVGGQPHGHGVFRSVDPSRGQQVYVGAWQNGVKHGYGVLSLTKERYLGMWKDDQRHEKGCQIAIDGVFHEGIFDRNRFTKGKIVYQVNEADPPASYEGDFEKIGVAAGKGILRVTPHDQIEGTIHGQVLSGELKITNATYTRKENKPTINISMADLQIVDEGPKQSQWAVAADLKWQEIFDQFVFEELGFAEAGNSEEEKCKRAWERLSSTLERIKTLKHISADERLERVPNVYEEWSPSYYATVCEFWNLFLSTPHHPINRLINGLVEIFCCSYNNIGTHPIMYDSAILEFTSLIRRAYGVMRHLFPHLPSVDHMHQPIPSNSDTASIHKPGEDGLSLSSIEEKDNLSVRSTTSKLSSNGSTSVSQSDDLIIATPCCDFVIHHFFGQCYAELFTMYSVKCHEMDRRYWEKVIILNTATDARLLNCLGVERGLWPTDSENTSDLDTFMVRVTARKKFYEPAINSLQRLSGAFNPSSKLAILAETFSEISACVSQFSSVGRAHVWSGDDLLPAFMYVVVRAQLQHLGAEIRLISDFCPQLSGSGQIDLMFTMLCASYVQICNEKSLP